MWRVPVGLLPLCLSLVVCQCQGAERVSAKSLLQHALHSRRVRSEPVTSYLFKRHADTLPMKEMDEVMALDREASLEVVQQSMTVQGTKVVKMQERYQGRVIPDAVVTLETDHEGRHVLDASGSVYRHIDLDFKKSSHLTPHQAKSLCKHYNNDESTSEVFSHEKVEEEVLFEGDNEPYPAYLVQYLVTAQEEEEDERRPICLIDARNSTVLVSWDALDTCTDCSATGIGGNLKVGKIQYGHLQRCLELRRENDTCYLENKYVRVLNNNFTRNQSHHRGDNTPVGSYNCEEIDDYVNGGYSPLLDALFYGTVVGRMFEEWYDMSPLGETAILRVHFGSNYSGASWNGYECRIGDGNGVRFHPLATLDVIGHEIAHGITEKNSNLYYYQQWGAINEAFSDMTGEVSEAYLGEADWLIGFEVAVEGTPPVRYFKNPELNNESISHVDDFTDWMDVHDGSGVYNRAFYILVIELGIPIREVYHVFLHANRMYWHHMSDYVHAACDVMKAAYDLGQDGSKFRQAFAEVGIEVCEVDDHVLGLKNKKVYTNIKVSRAITPTFVFAVPGEFAESVTVNASSPSGEVYIILSDKVWGAKESKVKVYGEGLHSVTYELPENITMYVTITLTTDSFTPLKDVTLVAEFNCIEEFTPQKSHESVVLFWHWYGSCVVEKEESEDSSNTDEEEEEEEKEEQKQEQEGKEAEAEMEPMDNLKKGKSSPSQSYSFFHFFRPFIVVVFPQSK